MKVYSVRTFVVGVLTASCVISVGCQTPQHSDNGAVIGALGGAGIGALIGDKNDAALPGALIGAGVGTLAGAAVGDAIDRDVERNRREASAQTAAAYEQRLAARPGAVTPEDVSAMMRAGLSEDVIAGQIHANGISRRLQVNDLINLRNQGVPDSVIKAMQTANVPTAATAAPVNTYGVAPAPANGQVIVEHHYGPPGYYWRPAPPPWGWCAPPHAHYHYRHHHPGPSPRVSWGFSVTR